MEMEESKFHRWDLQPGRGDPRGCLPHRNGTRCSTVTRTKPVPPHFPAVLLLLLHPEFYSMPVLQQGTLCDGFLSCFGVSLSSITRQWDLWAALSFPLQLFLARSSLLSLLLLAFLSGFGGPQETQHTLVSSCC